MQVGDFLVAYLQKIGVTHLFGIPGDLVINLFFKFGRPRGLKIVTLSHEPGVGFAADGYARATGRIGVVCVTYGAGGLNMVNPVAGSFSERVPILVLSGGPGEEERKLGQLIHHQAKEIESQCADLRRDHLRRRRARRSRAASPTRWIGSCARSGASSVPATSRSTATWSTARSPCRKRSAPGTADSSSRAPTSARRARRRARPPRASTRPAGRR